MRKHLGGRSWNIFRLAGLDLDLEDGWPHIIGAALALAFAGDEQLVGGSIRRCGGLLVNGSVTSVLLADAAGEPCALLPPAVERVTPAGRIAMRELVTSGVALEPLAPFTQPITAEGVDATACGDDLQIFVDEATNPDWASTATAYRIWADDVAPLAQMLGADPQVITVDPATTVLVRSQVISGGGLPTASERLRVSSAHIRTASSAPDVGLLPIPESTTGRLRSLTELLGELYR